MSELRRDLIKNKWIAVAADRALKPNDFPLKKIAMDESREQIGFCPFCGGNEAYTPPEIASFRTQTRDHNNSPEWVVRTIPNKFSAFALEGEMEEKRIGIYQCYNGLGQHEVVIETPEHGVEFHEFDLERIEMIISMFKLRYKSLSEDSRIKYIQIYKNRGLYGGASLSHSHSQIVALPFIPGENLGLPQYHAKHGSCLMCDILMQEQRNSIRVIYESKHFLVMCPYASRFPYETWIVPKLHTEHFGDMSPKEEKELAPLCKKLSTAIIQALDNPSYNFVINTAPLSRYLAPGYHWYMEFTPRLLVNAGVEVATGMYINPVSPELAAQILKANFK